MGGAIAHHAIEAMPVFACLDFLGVLGAYRRQVIGKCQAAFQKIDAPIKFQRVDCEQALRQADFLHGVARKRAVVAHVVDGEDHWHSLHGFIRGVFGAKQDGNEGRLPVVTMQKIRHPDLLAELDGRATKLRKTLRVIEIILAADAVWLLPIEILGIVHKKIVDSVQHPAVHD